MTNTTPAIPSTYTETLFLVSVTPAQRGTVSGFEALLINRAKTAHKTFLFEEQAAAFLPLKGKASEYLITFELKEARNGSRPAVYQNYSPIPDEAGEALAAFLG
jgi:hypothetical protein